MRDTLHSKKQRDCHSGNAQFRMTIGELVKEETGGNADGQAPINSDDVR